MKNRKQANVDISQWDINFIVNEVKKHLRNVESMEDLSDFIDYGSDSVEIALDFLVDSHAGIHMAEEAADLFGVELTPEDIEYDFGWGAVEEAAEPVAEALTDAMNAKGIPGSIFFGTTEGGDYAMFYIVDIDDVKYLLGFDVDQTSMRYSRFKGAALTGDDLEDMLHRLQEKVSEFKRLEEHRFNNSLSEKEEVRLNKLEKELGKLNARIK